VISSEKPTRPRQNPDSETLARINDNTTADVYWTGDGIHHGTISTSVSRETPTDVEIETENTASTDPEDIEKKLKT